MSDNNRTPKTSWVTLWPPERWLGQWVRVTTGTSSWEKGPGHPREITPPFPALEFLGAPLTQTLDPDPDKQRKTQLRGTINIQTRCLIWWGEIKGNCCTFFQSRCSVYINFSNHFLVSLSTVQLQANKKSWFDFQSCMGLVSLHQVVNPGSSNAHSHVLFPQNADRGSFCVLSISGRLVQAWWSPQSPQNPSCLAKKNQKKPTEIDPKNDRFVNYLTFLDSPRIYGWKELINMILCTTVGEIC